MLNRSLIWATAFVCLTLGSVVNAQNVDASSFDLSGWVKRVISTSPEIQAAQAAVEAAQARARAAGQPLFNPELQLDYEHTDVNSVSAGLSQTIDWSDKQGAQAVVAEAGVRAAQAGFVQQRQTIAVELLSRLSAFQVASARERVAESAGDLMMRFVELAERRYKLGDVGQIELDLAKLATAQAGFQLAGASANRITEEQALIAIVGAESSAFPEFPELPPRIEVFESERSAWINALPSVAAARTRMDVARSEVELRLREKRPDPTVGFRVGEEDDETLTGLSLSIPLFVRNTFSSEVEVANSELIKTQMEAANIHQRAAAGLDAAAQRYELLRNSWLLWEKSGKSSLDQQFSVLERLWRAGELSTANYLVQLKQALDTQASAIEQRGQMWQAWVDWLLASGQVDRWLTLSGEQQ